MGQSDGKRLDAIVARAQQERAERERGYREKALKLFPWVCGRCGREFDRRNVRELTVHHIDHNHDHNPEDGSNWELLCLYCHDHEHQREIGPATGPEAPRKKGRGAAPQATHTPFAGLGDLLGRDPEQGSD
ncbi:MAG: YajD family HNH nuclease [Halorhodospira halophila]|uniref:YajD family HNH nuclease n=1 Tax=Halorhodospira TaxID=85108 RepID=UPI0019136E1A|nr:MULTISPECIES: YajD family HNH nuclease [Halorhodospira]MBK5937527.1 HNH endonuclease [Halorhodospira halophila]MBK5943243.1 HNH endonuclease [Halorhodospira halophila]MCC3751614.1 YajD family HNH nuclease [Halorhodospira halophila]MCG5526765.1 YajD family HNH nuclease [Halorhodospira halophila]MCG5533383.1 YajD family HNH nuclease [Halorhodospira sp. 9621]